MSKARGKIKVRGNVSWAHHAVERHGADKVEGAVVAKDSGLADRGDEVRMAPDRAPSLSA
jgi:hypothetical protein